MQIPLQITFRNMPRSQAIEENIREKTNKLESFFDGITSCRVIVEAPHRHHYKGKAYVVRIDISVPGDELVINRAPKRLDVAKTADPQELEIDWLKATSRANMPRTKISTSPSVMPSTPPNASYSLCPAAARQDQSP